jgi:3',5'-cyclic AMP phosphodiesterase CpdA
MVDQYRPRNYAIVHLTDLHFPAGMYEPPWADALLRAFQHLADDRRIEIVALAVTGDLVNSPDADMFKLVRSFLKRAADSLRLLNDRGVDWDRVWMIDGNHDYRSWGLFKSNWLGIQEGGHLRRFDRYPAEDGGGPILAFGLNSSDRGSAARGRVALQDLRKIQYGAREAVGAFKYRVALVHHHLLPLPDRPVEFDQGAEKIRRKLYDESTKLLTNAGLVTNILLESSIDLVLHGHEHKQFAASVKYHDREWAGHIMAVVGGPAATAGFQVVTFAPSGDVELVRYERDETDYRVATKFFLWRYEDWKRVKWERLRRADGYYRKAVRRSDLSEIGDYRQLSDVSDIFGGENTDIEKIVIKGSTDDPKSGGVAIERVRDKTKAADVPSADLPPRGREVEYTLPLDPPAKRSAPHPGYVVSRTSGDNFVLTREEMTMRRPDGPNREFIRFHYPYPVEQLTVTHDFPVRYAPQQIEARARLREVPNTPEDVAETLRMRRHIFYDADKGQIWLSLDWVMPNHEYEFAWDLPSEAEVDAKNYDRATIGGHYLASSLALSPETANKAAEILVVLRQHCLEHIQKHARIDDQYMNSVFRPELDELSLWAFDQNLGQIRVVAATYHRESRFWRARLPWAAGVRGRSMRRGAVEYYRKRHTKTHANYYHALDGCSEETHLLCVPIFLPPDWNGGGAERAPIGVCKMVAALASTRDASLLHHLQDVTLRNRIAELIFFEIGGLIKEIVPLRA